MDEVHNVTLPVIGIIKTPFNKLSGMPIQPTGAAGITGEIEIYEKYAAGLDDIDGFSHIMLFYHLHECKSYSLKVTPFLDDSEHGIFATRSPKRPCPIGFSVVRLISRNGRFLKIENVDMLNLTPLLDIKPYVMEFDSYVPEKSGWFENKAKKAETKKSDDRFIR